ncbi:MAG: insulinase family protein, partial [Patescibacteria group bacterium]
AKVEKAFYSMPDGRKVNKSKVVEKQLRPVVKFKKKDADQTHVRIAVRAYDFYDELRFPLMILQTILGGNSSSRLWTEIREKLGLTYYVSASAEQYTDTGYMVAGAGVPHGTLPKVVKKIVQIFKDIKTKGVTDAELKLAKEFIAGSMPLAFESTDEVATYLASQELFYGKVMLPEEILSKVEKVTRSEVNAVAKDIFKPSKINMAAIGPHDDTKIYEKILNNL